jgi:iron(III) transport system substrate-binding protein
MKRARIIFTIIGIVASLSTIACSNTSQPSGEPQRELVIYSGRQQPLILPIITAFEKKTGIKVTLKSGSSQELANLLLEEKEKTQADVYISTDASLLEKLAQANLFTPITAQELSTIPAEYKSRESLWTGVSGRVRALIINTDLVSQAEKPDSIYSIVDPKWKGKVAMANFTNESVITHISALRVLHDDQFASNFLNGIQKNGVKVLSGHTGVRQAVAKGEFSIGLVNHYYGHLQQKESGNIEIIYPDQRDNQDGAFTNISGVGIIKYGNSSKESQEFVKYLLSGEAQKIFAELNYEFPLQANIRSSNTKNIGEFKKMNVDLHKVAKGLDETIQLIKGKGL